MRAGFRRQLAAPGAARPLAVGARARCRCASRRASFALCCALALLAWLASPSVMASSQEGAPPGPEAGATNWRALLEQLGSSDSGTHERADRRLQGGGAPVARAALESFEQVSLALRREWARVIQREADVRQLDAVLALLASPDVEVREQVARFLAHPDLGPERIERRVQVLEELARADQSLELRHVAIRLLGELDEEGALPVLARLIAELPSEERVRAARALPETKRSRELVKRLVAAGFEAPPAQRTPADVLALLLPLHGRLLADDPSGGTSARDCAPLVLGLKHPDARVRLGASRGFERLLTRLRELGEASRALRLLAALGETGLDRRLVHYYRARLAFYPGADPAAALQAARQLRAEAGSDEGGEDIYQESLWRFRSLHLEAMASWGIGQREQALDLFGQAATTLDGLLAERLDLSADDASRLRHLDALQQRALVAISSACCQLAAGRSPTSVLSDVRLAHVLSLEAQIGYASLRGEGYDGWDSLLDSELSPFRLLFTELEWPELAIPERLELQAALGSLMASVSVTEMPGFRPLPSLAAEMLDPLADPYRRTLLQRIPEGRLEALEEEINQAQRRMFVRRASDPGRIPVKEQEELTNLLRTRGRILRSMSQWEETGYKELLELRTPSSLGLWLARDLRNEGRAAESRRYAERMRDDLEESGFFRSYFWGLERLAQIEMAIGNSFTDEGEPERAREELEKAVERLRGIEERLAELGAAPVQIEIIRGIRSTALVGLAVNANVKLHDAEQALAYYERAYALRKDDFMRVLLACYRARSGRETEARVLLRELKPRPQLYYNLACTHALLGDTERALDYLERELQENLSSEAARDRQREWAREDPDLQSLRQDPRFQRLLEAR